MEFSPAPKETGVMTEEEDTVVDHGNGSEKTYHSLEPLAVDSITGLLPSDAIQKSTDDKSDAIVFFDPLAACHLVTPEGIKFELKPLIVLDSREDEDTGKGRRKRAQQDTTTDLCKAKMARISDDALHLRCDWEDCPKEAEVFSDMKVFMAHVSEHVNEVDVKYAEENEEDEEDSYACLWRECGFETASSVEMVRHVHFHTFHTKIKFHGDRVVRETGVAPCQLDESQRNLVPDLSEPFKCLWNGCSENGDKDEEFSQAQRFYWHVEWHAEEFRGVRKEVSCRWADCKSVVTTVNKLKDHLRSHSQERTVGCPVCGGLFSNRSKFYDHCKRQQQSTGNFHCDYCRKSYADERLLRNHMRSHINNYKCPFCDMTCSTPSGLSTHVTYKHTEERPFACDACDHRAKREVDLFSHQARVHGDQTQACHIEDCQYMSSSKLNMRLHLHKCHSQDGDKAAGEPLYCCHICPKSIANSRRYSKISHRKKSHHFNWPAGHSRFRYRQGEDGLFQVLTVSFENADPDEPPSLSQ